MQKQHAATNASLNDIIIRKECARNNIKVLEKMEVASSVQLLKPKYAIGYRFVVRRL